MTAPRLIRIATRRSDLALWQAEHIADQLRAANPGLTVELVKMKTQGDIILDTPLAKIGGKALFVKELEQGLLEGRADLAVHSMKDVPVDFPEGLHLPVICERDDPCDAFVSNAYAALDALPRGGRVGTSSLRRQCQISARRPDLEILTLRGNVNTRLRKLDEGEFDAIILASVGLKRLGMEDRIRLRLDPAISLPAIGQGALGLECRIDDAGVNALIAPLNHATSSVCVRAERAVNTRLHGSCQVPIGAYAELTGDRLHLRALVGRPDGSEILSGEIEGTAGEAEALGLALADELLGRGAAAILEAVYADGD